MSANPEHLCSHVQLSLWRLLKLVDDHVRFRVVLRFKCQRQVLVLPRLAFDIARCDCEDPDALRCILNRRTPNHHVEVRHGEIAGSVAGPQVLTRLEPSAIDVEYCIYLALEKFSCEIVVDNLASAAIDHSIFSICLDFFFFLLNLLRNLVVTVL